MRHGWVARGPALAPGWQPRLAAGRPDIPRVAIPPNVPQLSHVLLDRYGIVTRGAATTEGIVGGFAGVYRVLSALEDAGTTRRGYFVEGLGAAQFASPGAVDQLRVQARKISERQPGDSPDIVLLAACDPANPMAPHCRGPHLKTNRRSGTGPEGRLGRLLYSSMANSRSTWNGVDERHWDSRKTRNVSPRPSKSWRPL